MGGRGGGGGDRTGAATLARGAFAARAIHPCALLRNAQLQATHPPPPPARPRATRGRQQDACAAAARSALSLPSPPPPRRGASRAAAAAAAAAAALGLGLGAAAAAQAGDPPAAAAAAAAHAPLPTDKLCCKRAAAPPRTPLVLVSAGSFNPPTFMHVRMCEVAAQALAQVGRRQPAPNWPARRRAAERVAAHM